MMGGGGETLDPSLYQVSRQLSHLLRHRADVTMTPCGFVRMGDLRQVRGIPKYNLSDDDWVTLITRPVKRRFEGIWESGDLRFLRAHHGHTRARIDFERAHVPFTAWEVDGKLRPHANLAFFFTKRARLL